VEPNGWVYAYFSNHNDEALRKQGRDPDNLMLDLKRTYKNLGVIHGPLTSFVTPRPVDVVWTSLNYHDLHNKNFGVDVNVVLKQIYQARSSRAAPWWWSIMRRPTMRLPM
jgi:predicted methyltransferase